MRKFAPRPSGRILIACLAILSLILAAAVAMKPSEFGFERAAISPSIDGIGSAKLGLTEGQLRKALSNDFGATDEGIIEVVHPGTGNRLLMIAVRGLVPGAPVARVTFSFNPQSKLLSRINVTWIEGKEPGIDESALLAVAKQLIDQFERLGYSSNILNGKTDGKHLFATTDQRGHRMDILYRPATTPSKGAGAESAGRAARLTLSIHASFDPANADRS